ITLPLRAPYPLLLTPLLFYTPTAPTQIYTLSLHDALPISSADRRLRESTRYFRHMAAFTIIRDTTPPADIVKGAVVAMGNFDGRSEEHTSELQSLRHLVCRLLLEKKKSRNDTTEFDKRPRD